MTDTAPRRISLLLSESLAEEVEEFRLDRAGGLSTADAARKLIAIGLLTWRLDQKQKRPAKKPATD